MTRREVCSGLVGLWLLGAAAGCSLLQTEPVEVNRGMVTPVVVSSEAATAAERIAYFETLLPGPAPSPILDVHYVEVQLGDNELGPADYQFFGRVEVAPEAIPEWQAWLQAESTMVAAALPQAPDSATWWFSAQEATGYLFYAAQPRLGRDGFIALNQAGEGIIYLFTMTR